MTVDDAWRLARDIYSFGWLPVWLRLFLFLMAVVVAAGLVVGRLIRVGGEGGNR